MHVGQGEVNSGLLWPATGLSVFRLVVLKKPSVRWSEQCRRPAAASSTQRERQRVEAGTCFLQEKELYRNVVLTRTGSTGEEDRFVPSALSS